jgi:CDP-2,3-bis-(O-geranylgeranyl)-sn-glycerol synthase
MLELLFLFGAYALPLYIANATPVLIHGKKPLDFNKTFRNKRILGDGKSIVGTIAGIIGGFFSGIIFSIIFPEILIIIPNYYLLSFLLGLGAMAGDITESFFKRQLNMKRGQELFLADQLDFVLGGLLLSSIVRFPEWQIIAIFLLITIFLHRITNFIAFKLKLKKVPW